MVCALHSLRSAMFNLWNFLTLLLVFCRLSLLRWVPVWAFGVSSTCWKIEQVKESSDYTYRVLSDNTVEILKYSGAESNVTVPDKIDNKVVKCVGYGAFAENENIVGVTIPAQVTDLQYGVFASCANLETVTFKAGSKLQKIAARAFENCSKLQSISLPDSVQTIEEKGFAYCKNLGTVDLGNGLKEIDNYTFYHSGVTRIRIPDSTTEVGKCAFAGCSLDNVILGSGLKGIEESVFSGCGNLKQIEIPDNITYISDRAFSYAGLTSVEIPDSVTVIKMRRITVSALRSERSLIYLV